MQWKRKEVEKKRIGEERASYWVWISLNNEETLDREKRKGLGEPVAWEELQGREREGEALLCHTGAKLQKSKREIANNRPEN